MKKILLMIMVLWSAGLEMVLGCDVPVFRYALENWSPELFTAVIFRDSKPFAGELEKVIEEVDKMQVNLGIMIVDVTKDIPVQWKKAYEENSKSLQLPFVVLFYPDVGDLYGEKIEPKVVWSGQFNPTNFRSLVTSAAREQIVKKLLAGDSVVWVLLESGDEGKDEVSAKVLENAFNKLKKELRGWYEEKRKLLLGNITPEEEKGIPFKLEFSLIRIRRNDPAEQVFIAMLIGLESELEKVHNEPIVYPFFGCGRVMPPLIGKGINEEMIFAVSGFLLGDCACTIKDMNPGKDTLLPVNWSAKLSELSPTLLSAQILDTDLAGVFQEPDETTNVSNETIQQQKQQPVNVGTSNLGIQNRVVVFFIFVLIVAGVIVGGVAFLLMRRKLK